MEGYGGTLRNGEVAKTSLPLGGRREEEERVIQIASFAPTLVLRGIPFCALKKNLPFELFLLFCRRLDLQGRLHASGKAWNGLCVSLQTLN